MIAQPTRPAGRFRTAITLEEKAGTTSANVYFSVEMSANVRCVFVEEGMLPRLGEFNHGVWFVWPLDSAIASNVRIAILAI